MSKSVEKLRMFLVNRLRSLEDNLKFFFASIDDISWDILINLLDSLLILECKLSEQSGSHGFGVWEKIVFVFSFWFLEFTYESFKEIL